MLIGLEWCSILNELKVLDLICVGTIDLLDGIDFLIRHGETKVGQGLSELLRRYLEVLVTIPVLEEALRVESVSLEPVLEGINYILGNDSLVL